MNPIYQKVQRAIPANGIAATDGIITGHAIVFNQTTNIGGLFYERIAPEALNGCDLTDVLFLLNHNMDGLPLARSRRNTSGSSMQLELDDTGLKFTARVDVENNPDAAALCSAVKRGDITGMSFLMWIPPEGEEWSELRDGEMPTRNIRRIDRVPEISAVNFPAYGGTDIHARNLATLESDKRALESARAILRPEGIKRARQNALKIFEIRWRLT